MAKQYALMRKLPQIGRAALLLIVLISSSSLLISAEEGVLLNLLTQIDFREIQTEFGISVDSQIPTQDVWAEGNLAIVSGGTLIHLVDLSDLTTTPITTIELDAGYQSWDSKILDGYLYVGLQSSNDGTTMLIYNVKDPENPQLASKYASASFAGAHNVFVVDKVAFIATFGASGSSSVGLRPDGGVWMVDVSDPVMPVEIGPARDVADNNSLIRQIHDLTVVGNRAYLAGWSFGFWILDFENLDDPANLTYEVVAQHNYDPLPGTGNRSSSTHNLWPSADGTILWSSDETTADGIRAFDISDLENIELLGVYSLGAGTLAHNVIVDGDYAYVAYYSRGLRVLQLDDAAGIVEVAEFDTSGGRPSLGMFSGAWTALPLGDRVLVSDTRGGLSVFEKNFGTTSDPATPDESE
jgi:hypothetical protein